MANKARAAGLERTRSTWSGPGNTARPALINLHRGQLARDWTPTDEELKAYFEANKDRITVPEMRKVQMVVLKTKEEAEDIKAKIDSGEMTMFEAARDYSIDPKAKQTLGEMGWQATAPAFRSWTNSPSLSDPMKSVVRWNHRLAGTW